MNDLNKPVLFRVLLLLFLGLVAIRIYQHFPAPSEYYSGADEGTYFRQAQTVRDHGVAGFRQIMSDYNLHEELQSFPTPLRVLHIFFAAIAVSFSDSMHSLSVLSLCWFVAFCLMSWFYLRKFCGEKTAVITGVFLACSPLLSAMARRALMDSEFCFFNGLALFLLICYCREFKKRDGVLLVLTLTACLLIKESFQVIYPFFPAYLLYTYWKKKEAKLFPVIIIAVLPVLFTLAAYLVVFGGLGSVLNVYEITGNVILLHPIPYVVDFGSGPWYQYFIDFFLLSPVISVLFFLYCGYFLLGSGQGDGFRKCLLLYFTCFMVYHAFLPKNIRYAISLELIYCLFAALCLQKMAEKIQNLSLRKASLVLSVLCILALQQYSFARFFLTGKVYDTVAANLLRIEKIIPAKPFN
jgi:hypothetical protein